MKAVINSSLLTTIKPAEKQFDIWDKKLTGLILRVNPNGNMVYRCEFGRGRRITIGNAKILTPMQARDRAKEILADAVRGIDPRAVKKSLKNVTLKSYIENTYKPWVIAHRKSGKETIARIKQCFFSNFGNQPLLALTTLDLEKWRTQKLNRGCNANTVNRDIIALRAAISVAVTWNIIESHPLAKLKLVKVDDSPKVRFLDKYEEKRLRQSLDRREEKLKAARERANQSRAQQNRLPNLRSQTFADIIMPMVLLSLNTGIRRGELFSLSWENVNLNTNPERATLTVLGENAKSGKTRHVPLNAEAFRVLKAWSAQTDTRGLVFPNRDGGRLTHVKRTWSSLLRDAEIENFRWHDMRHHFASCLVMAGVDLNTVRELLGHSDIKMTLRYAHLAPEHKAEAVAKLVSTAKFKAII